MKKLIYPAGYVHNADCGCGPEGAKVDLVPDTLWGLDVRPACQIHDYMYGVGGSEMDRRVADDLFRTNMLTLLDNKPGNWLVTLLRRRAIKVYHAAVREHGHQFFTYRLPAR